MTKNLLALSALLAAVGTGFMIAGVTSPSVVKVCKDLEILPPSTSPHFGSHKMPKRNRKPVQMCISQGFFFIGIDLPDGTLYLPTPLEKQSSVMTAIVGLLLVGGMAAMLSTLFYSVAACYADDKKGKILFMTTKRNITGTTFQLISVSLFVIGLSLYTNYKIKTIGNSEEFRQQIVAAITGFDSVFDMSGDNVNLLQINENSSRISEKVNNESSSKADESRELQNNRMRFNISSLSEFEINEQGSADYDVYEINTSNELSQFTTVSPQNVFSHSSSVQQNGKVRRSLSRNLFHGRGASPRRRGMQNMRSLGFAILSQLKQASPILGYSFYFLWIGCLCHVIAFCIGIFNSRYVCSKKRVLKEV